MSGYLILDSNDTLNYLTMQYDSFNENIIAYDIVQNEIVNAGDRLMIDRVKFLNVGNAIYFNPASAGFGPSSNDEITGLVQLNFFSDEQDYMIGRYAYSIIERARYNPVLDTGTKDDRFTLITRRYLFINGEYYYLPESKRKIRAILEETLELTVDRRANLKKDEALIEVLNASL